MKSMNYLTALLLVLLLNACGGGSDETSSSNKSLSSAVFLNSDYYGKWSYVDTAETVNIISTTDLNASVVDTDKNLLKVDDNGTLRYLIRSGIAKTEVRGKVEVANPNGASPSSSKSLQRGFSFGGIANIKIILSNVLDSNIREETKTTSDGSFTTTTLPSGLYNLEAANDDLTLNTQVEILNQENNIGVYKLTGNDLHNFKAELILNEEYVVSDNKVHEAVLRIHNISDNVGFGLSYDISLDTNESLLSFSEGSADSLGSVQAKAYKDIPISFAFDKLNINRKKYGVDVVINDALGNQWIDTFTFDVHKELVAILIRTDAADIKGYLKNPITGEMKVIDTANGNILVPLMPDDKPYTLILANPSYENETRYSIGINRTPEDLSTFKDTAAQEPNNDESTATGLNINDVTLSYLHATDIDYWKIYTHEGIVVDTTSTKDFANTQTIPSSIPVLAVSDGVFTDKIQVSWNSVSNTTYYELYQSTAIDGVYTVLENNLVDTDIDITNVFVNTTYFYKLKACNSKGCGDFSSINSGYLDIPNNLPIADVGDNNITISGGESVDLNASSSSDIDGVINFYKWVENSTVLSTNITFTLNNLSAGDHEIILVVTDDRGGEATDTIHIRVNAIAPIANAGVDKVTLVGTSVELSGSASSDSDGSIISYLWKDGTTTLATLETFSTSSLSLGVHTITLSVTDNDGEISTDTVTVRINAAPVANAGVDKSVTLGSDLSLSGNLSSDDGSIVSYQWKELTLILSTQKNFTTDQLSLGSHTLTLMVTDNDGVSSSDTVVVTITETPNIVPIANAGVDQVVEKNILVTLDGGTSSDSDGSIASYRWIEGTLLLSSSSLFTISSLSLGEHTIQLEVTDDAGAVASDTVTITINDVPNIAPQANAGVDQTVNEEESVTFTSTSTDSDGSIGSLIWEDGSIILSTSSSFNISTLSVGTHTVTLTVTDDKGAISTDTVTIIVNALANTAPIANAGSDRVILLGNSTTLDASDSVDTNGNIVSYLWIDGSTYLSSAKTFTLSSLTAGIHSIELSVTDNDGAINKNTVEIRVNTIPIANAGVNQEVTFGNDVSFDAVLSSDDVSIAAYKWLEGTTVLSNTQSFTITSLSIGTHTITLEVIDGDGESAVDTLELLVNEPPNVSPTANAGTDKLVQLGISTTLTSNSTDIDGTIVSYEWKDGTTLLATSEIFSTSSLSTGMHNITLTVIDDDGASSSDIVKITVNSPPIAIAGDAITINENGTVDFDGSMSSDSDGSIVSYEWSLDTVFNVSTVTTTQTFADSGFYDVTLKVTDNDGGISTALRSVYVNYPLIINTPSVVYTDENQNILLEIDATNPNGGNLEYSTPGSAYDIDGINVNTATGVINLQKVEYLYNSSTGNYDKTAVNVNIDYETKTSYSFNIKVLDSASGLSTSKSVQVVVNNLYEAPSITSTYLTIAESFTSSGKIYVNNPNNSILTYTITGGEDAAAFTMNSSNGVVTLANIADFKSPTDENNDSIYKIEVSVDDGVTPIFKNLDVRIVQISKNGTYYSFITSAVTGEVWLDTNLGAVACNGGNIPECKGLYYQWGRYNSGYEQYNSSTSTNKLDPKLDADYDYKNEYSTKFILSNSTGDSEHDWQIVDGDQQYGLARENILKTVNHKHQICPSGYRLPSPEELLAEDLAQPANASAFGLTEGTGYRYETNGSYNRKAFNIYLWTYSRYYLSGSLPSSSPSRFSSIAYSSARGGLIEMKRSRGYQVRCIQN